MPWLVSLQLQVLRSRLRLEAVEAALLDLAPDPGVLGLQAGQHGGPGVVRPHRRGGGLLQVDLGVQELQSNPKQLYKAKQALTNKTHRQIPRS